MLCRLKRPTYRSLKNVSLCCSHISYRDGVSTRDQPDSFPTRIRNQNQRFASCAISTTLQNVPTLPDWDVTTFRERAFVPELPALLPQDASRKLPASQSWFETDGKEPSSRSLKYDYLSKYGDAVVPLEVTRKNRETGTDTFERFDAPLQLFLTYLQYGQNQRHQHQEIYPSAASQASSPLLYLAQCQLSSLPPALQSTLPTPTLVLHTGKGDIYDANLWIGSPPTYTPLHRDPNPNFFLQLAGTKVVRLFPPDTGREIFSAVQEKLGRGGGSAVFRGEEMMQGAERELLEREVWRKEGGDLAEEGYEAVVEEGNALFIPLGWWHSIKSVGTGVTASVNWWFR